MTKFTHINLDELEDMAPKFGYENLQEARFATKSLGCEQTGLSYLLIKPGQRQPFAHRHERQEEIYVVLEGNGTVVLDNERVDVGVHDALRLAPTVVRSFEAGADGLRLLAFGAPAISEGRNDALMLETSSPS